MEQRIPRCADRFANPEYSFDLQVLFDRLENRLFWSCRYEFSDFLVLEVVCVSLLQWGFRGVRLWVFLSLVLIRLAGVDHHSVFFLSTNPICLGALCST